MQDFLSSFTFLATSLHNQLSFYRAPRTRDQTIGYVYTGEERLTVHIWIVFDNSPALLEADPING